MALCGQHAQPLHIWRRCSLRGSTPLHARTRSCRRSLCHIGVSWRGGPRASSWKGRRWRRRRRRQRGSRTAPAAAGDGSAAGGRAQRAAGQPVVACTCWHANWKLAVLLLLLLAGSKSLMCKVEGFQVCAQGGGCQVGGACLCSRCQACRAPLSTPPLLFPSTPNTHLAACSGMHPVCPLCTL